MQEKDASAQTEAIQSAGAKALLYVTGSASTLKDPAASTAAILEDAVTAGGYDGLFLDLPALKDTNKSDFTALVRSLREALGGPAPLRDGRGPRLAGYLLRRI